MKTVVLKIDKLNGVQSPCPEELFRLNDRPSMTKKTTLPVVRKGAAKISDIPAAVLQELESGNGQTLTLVECLAIDQTKLLKAVFPKLGVKVFEQAQVANELGVSRRMAAMGKLLLEALGPTGIDACKAHRSDMVRGWACFMIGSLVGLTVKERLTAIQSLADDAHFGVREWAWLAIRPKMVADLKTSVDLMVPWTKSPSPYLRRFVSESLRPRGVWCAHISELKESPELAIRILEPLRNDTEKYVQDSVANWLNDAGKDQPDWVKNLCKRWIKESPTPATIYIGKRALRNL